MKVEFLYAFKKIQDSIIIIDIEQKWFNLYVRKLLNRHFDTKFRMTFIDNRNRY